MAPSLEPSRTEVLLREKRTKANELLTMPSCQAGRDMTNAYIVSYSRLSWGVKQVTSVSTCKADGMNTGQFGLLLEGPQKPDLIVKSPGA
jgi:hypothetical protein